MQPTAQAKPPPPVITLDSKGIAGLARDFMQLHTPPARRAVLAIAGIPGSGKSTLAHAITDAINHAIPNSAILLPMDGFHMSNTKLAELGLTNRKGAPQTFEAQRYFKLLTQLRDRARRVSIPVFDRTVDEPVFTGKPEHTADTSTRWVITEGNYLLLDTLPWTEIDALADVRVMIDTPIEQAKQWVINRHKSFGRSPQQAKLWYETNDLLNTQYIHAHSRHADRIARWPD